MARSVDNLSPFDQLDTRYPIYFLYFSTESSQLRQAEFNMRGNHRQNRFSSSDFDAANPAPMGQSQR
jgi:hypothetical protein